MPEWIVEISDTGAAELAESFRQGPIVDDSGRRGLEEQQVARLVGLKISVFSDEHPPPHFRVSFQGESADYRISDCQRLTPGLTRYYRNVKRWHSENKQLLIDAWDSSQPTDCPVGAIVADSGDFMSAFSGSRTPRKHRSE